MIRLKANGYWRKEIVKTHPIMNIYTFNGHFVVALTKNQALSLVFKGLHTHMAKDVEKVGVYTGKRVKPFILY